MLDSAQFVEDMDKVIKFYGDILGFNKIFDQVLPMGLVDEVIKVPSGTEVRMVIFHKTGSNTPIFEFLQCSIKGEYLSAKPPNLGIFAISLESNDLSGLTNKIVKEGFQILSGPVKLKVGTHGKISTITVEGPNKEKLEFFEKSI
jgi:hypothetical protein